MGKSDARRELLDYKRGSHRPRETKKSRHERRMEQRKRNGFVKDSDTRTSYNYRNGDEADTDLLRLTRMPSRGYDGVCMMFSPSSSSEVSTSKG